MSWRNSETDPVGKYDDLENSLGDSIAREANFLHRRRVSREEARAYDLQDAKQDIYLAHFKAKTDEFSSALASRSVPRESRGKPPIVSLSKPIFKGDEQVGELGDTLPADEDGLERVEDREEAHSILERIRRSPQQQILRSFDEDLEEGKALTDTQRQRKRRLKQSFQEENRLIGSRFRHKDKPPKK